MQYADYVFCNDEEARIFGEVNKIDNPTMENVALALAKWNKINTKRPRVAVITQGAKPTLVAIYQEGQETQSLSFEVPAIS